MEEVSKLYYTNGNIMCERYYISNKLHRQNGPAVIYYDRNGKIEIEVYYKDDCRHRENGPAAIWYYESGKISKIYYYINDKEIIDEFQIMVIKGLEIENSF